MYLTAVLWGSNTHTPHLPWQAYFWWQWHHRHNTRHRTHFFFCLMSLIPHPKRNANSVVLNVSSTYLSTLSVHFCSLSIFWKEIAVINVFLFSTEYTLLKKCRSFIFIMEVLQYKRYFEYLLWWQFLYKSLKWNIVFESKLPILAKMATLQ